MRSRFRVGGGGSEYVRAFTGHSPKRDGVQLLRFLGCKDKLIMAWFGVTGPKAYLRYTELAEGLQGLTVPEFFSATGLHAHVQAQKALNKAMEDDNVDDVEFWLNDL